MNRSDCSLAVIFFEEPELAFFLAAGFFDGGDWDLDPSGVLGLVF